MGYSKFVRVSPTKVMILHQLDSNGERYAEDAVITAPPGRLDWLMGQYDGKIGSFNFSFAPAAGAENAGVSFPDAPHEG